MATNKILRTCSRCGGLHPLGQRCFKNARNYYQGDPEIRKFRNSVAWKNKAEEIKARDKYLCQICLKKNIINTRDLSVHHITPVAESQALRLENGNLITVCDECHKKAEVGKIPRAEQQAIVDEIMKAY